MKLITPTADMATGRPAYQVWEYDTARPRNVNAVDPRARYAVKACVGSFPSLEAAHAA